MRAFRIRIALPALLLAIVAAAAPAAVLAQGAGYVPVHGTILANVAPHAVIAALDAVPGVAGSQTRRYQTTAHVRVGETFDAFWRNGSSVLDALVPAAEFVNGLPNRVITHILATGDRLPPYRFVREDGRLTTFGDLRGRVVLLSFIYTRCPDRDICPAISGKYAYLQHHLDPKQFALVELTLDPQADSPPALAAYARRFGAEPAHWSLWTGESAQVKDVLDAFALDSLQTDPGRIIHGDKLVIIDRSGTIADIIPTSGWEPDDAIATAENVAGLSSNPLRRFELATVAGVIAFCGGAVSTGTVVLDSLVFLLGVGVLGGMLVWITKRIIVDERY